MKNGVMFDTMRPNGVMGPLDIFNAINEQFDDAIIVTDVGQLKEAMKQVGRIDGVVLVERVRT